MLLLFILNAGITVQSSSVTKHGVPILSSCHVCRQCLYRCHQHNHSKLCVLKLHIRNVAYEVILGLLRLLVQALATLIGHRTRCIFFSSFEL